MTQTGIAVEVGVSQMQVTRPLEQSLARLRVDMLASMSDRPPRSGSGRYDDVVVHRGDAGGRPRKVLDLAALGR